MSPRGRRLLPWAGVVAMLLLVSGMVLAVLGSRLPATYSAMDMGYADPGGGPTAGHHGAHGRSVDELVGDRDAVPDVRYTLTVRRERTVLADGTEIDAYTVNGRTPGPTIEAAAGQLVEVVLRNEGVAGGATLHWHGLDVPNGEDGVAGVTQDAVPPGAFHTYRFRADQVGTFWYHSHQISHEQVVGGLLGPVVIRPPGPTPPREGRGTADVVAPVHTYEGYRTIAGRGGDHLVPVPTGTRVRIRLVNTDNGPTQAWVAGAGFTVAAVDGEDLHGPTPVRDRSVTLTAGGRADLVVDVPPGGARVQLPGVSLGLGPEGADPPRSPAPRLELDLLSYGTSAPVGFDPTRPDREFDYDIGRRYGLLDGRPGSWWTINGGILPDVPMFVVREGDVVVMRIRNHSGDVHPMHLHGHHVTVLARDGVPATGSPWRVDSLNVRDGETWEVGFVADNPGIWMDHCHNLPHAREGLMTHLMYEGVSTPYLLGRGSGNEPE